MELGLFRDRHENCLSAIQRDYSKTRVTDVSYVDPNSNLQSTW